jgi:hypothetical protein
LATQQALLEAKANYNNALRARPFNTVNIINAKNKIKELESGLNDIAELAILF